MEGATSVLVNVSGSRSLKLAELDAVAETLLAATSKDTNLIFGMSLQPSLRDEVQVTLIATGFAAEDATAAGAPGWRPVWLRRAEDAANPLPEAAQDPIREPRPRREKRAAARAARVPEAPTSTPALPPSDGDLGGD